MVNDHGYTVPTADWFQGIADSVLGVVFFVLQIHPKVAFEYVNAGHDTELVGYRVDNSAREAAVLLSHIHPDSQDQLNRLLTLSPGSVAEVELKWRHITGHVTYSRGRARSRERPDGSVVVEGALQDVTDLHKAQEAVARSEERHRLLAEHAADIVWAMAPDGTITYVSAAVAQLRGLPATTAIHQRIDQVFSPSSCETLRGYGRQLRSALEDGVATAAFDGDLDVLRNDGSLTTCHVTVIPHLDRGGRLVELVGTIRDVGEQRSMEAELRRLATTDPLTGVANRRRAEEQLAEALPTQHPSALLVIDIDEFKRINDSQGHAAGDRALMEVARCIAESVRSNDVVARWGGDEFLVVLRDCGMAEALEIAGIIRSKVVEVGFPASVGAAELMPDQDWIASLHRADGALYRAKRTGRGSVSA